MTTGLPAAETATAVSHRLRSVYGSPRHGNHDDPLDELVFIVLSQMTTQPSFDRVFHRLRSVPGGWQAVVDMGGGELRRLIGDAGLAGQRAPRLQAALSRVRTDFGKLSLEGLRDVDDTEVEAYLTSLPGVGSKTARCVMMYSLGRRVLPADTHVTRVARRLGLIPQGLGPTAVHAALDQVVTPSERYSFHVNGLAHGRAVCQARAPRCAACVVADLCASADSTSQTTAVRLSSRSTRTAALPHDSRARAARVEAQRGPAATSQQTASTAKPPLPTRRYQRT